MKREIKFRAWMKDQKEMVEVEWLGKEMLQPQGYEIESIDEAVIMQYTGLKDKNGKEIYEGDILRDSLGWVFAVEWDSDNARFLGRHTKPRGDTYICYVGREPKAEIIGSIYDNPELLQEVDK